MITQILSVKRALLWAAFAALLIIMACTSEWLPKRLIFSPARAATGVPLTVTRTEKGYDSQGTLRYTNQYTEAFRSDGSYMRSFVSSLVQQRRIDYANGDEIETNEVARKRSTAPGKFSLVLTRRDPDKSCITPSDVQAGSVLEGTETIGGFRAVRLRLSTQKRTFRTWYAADAGCAVVQQHLEHEDGVTDQTLVSLTVAEPDQTLFQVSPAFEEVPPSGLYVPICINGKCTSPPQSFLQRLDNNYYKRRANNL